MKLMRLKTADLSETQSEKSLYTVSITMEVHISVNAINDELQWFEIEKAERYPTAKSQRNYSKLESRL